MGEDLYPSEGGWALRTTLLRGDAVDDGLLDATAPALGGYTQDDPRDYPVDDLKPPRAAWLPDGRLALVATNKHFLYAWDLASGEHEVLHRRDELPSEDHWWIKHAGLEGVFVAPEQAALYLTYGEDLPRGGTPVARCHWLRKPLGGELEYLGFHGSHHLVGAAGSELLGLNSWHRGSMSMEAWTPGEEVSQETRLFAENVMLAPGTCVRRGTLRTSHPVQRPAHVEHYDSLLLPPEIPLSSCDSPPPSGSVKVEAKSAEPLPPPGTPLVFYTPNGAEVVSELSYPGSLEESYLGVAHAWGGRLVMRGEDGRSLVLYHQDKELARRELPSDLPLDGHWACAPHPSGWLVGLSISQHEEFVLFDLRDGSHRSFPLPKYFSGYRVRWSPDGTLALLEKNALILRPA